jgi:hypothetical protein
VQPVRVAVTAGQTATFSVIATGSAQLNYQWLQNGTAIAGATSSIYTTPATTVAYDGALFTVVIGNAVGSVVSSPARLSVNSTQGRLTPNPASVNFGTVNLGTTSTASVTLSNSVSSYVTILNVSVSGPGVNAGGVPAGTILAPGGAATLEVVFAPAGTGILVGAVTISSDAAGSPLTIPLSGTAANAAHSANLIWDPSISSVFGYYVYRGPALFGPYTRLTSAPVTTTNFSDLTVQAGQTYFYWVTAVDLSTVESIFSNSVPAVVPAP